MFIPRASALNSHSTIIPPVPLDSTRHFSLDIAGVMGLLGGDDAISAMATMRVYGNGRWLGWYNTPGSSQIAKKLNSFMSSSCVDHSPKFPSQKIHADPTALIGLDCGKGPKFRAAYSGTVMEETGPLAALFMKECAAWNSEGNVISGRRTQPIGVTIADLGQAPASEMFPAQNSAFALLSAGTPITASIGTCALSALRGDWYASSLILVGIIASGFTCLVLGSANLVFTHPEPSKGSPAGDGILGSDKEIVLLRGTESAVNSITRGSFTLRFSSAAHFGLLGWCSTLFFIQCISQLLLVPQASLFGQVMFLISLGVSALHNARLSSPDKEKVHRKLLFQGVLENPTLTRYTLGTRTTAMVFILLVLRPQNPMKLLDELLPNDTKIWRQWKATIVEALRHPSDKVFLSENIIRDVDGFTEQEFDLLALLYGDARAAYEGYKDYLRVDSL